MIIKVESYNNHTSKIIINKKICELTMTSSALNIPKIMDQYQQFCDQNGGFDTILILTSTGDLEYISDKNFCTPAQAKDLYNAWINHESAVTMGNDRYPILNWEILQFAARNVHKKGALVGCKTKTNRYVVCHLSPQSNNAPTIAAIKLNRFSWNVI